jgi:hypothetical protein
MLIGQCGYVGIYFAYYRNKYASCTKYSVSTKSLRGFEKLWCANKLS